jgi:hypothetical protein
MSMHWLFHPRFMPSIPPSAPQSPDEQIRAGWPVEAIRGRDRSPSRTGFVTHRRRWWGRVDIHWVSGETTTVRKCDLRRIPTEPIREAPVDA